MNELRTIDPPTADPRTADAHRARVPEAGSRIRIALERPAFALHIDTALPPDGITAVHGPSGAGKTTLLRCVAGLERASGAIVEIAGDTWQDDARGIFVPAWRRPVGYVFQEANLFEHLDVRGNLDFGRRRARADAGASRDAIELLGIGDLLARDVRSLSGGERQRVAIARAIAAAPRLLLLDEPLAAVDAARKQEILPWLERMRDELRIPMLYVTHASEEVARLARTVLMLDRGRLVAAGPATEVFTRVDSAPLFGDEAGALLLATVRERDARWQLARVDFDGGSLWLRDSGHAVGQTMRLRVLARDVSIATVEPQATSIQNVLPCVVRVLVPDAHPSQVTVQLACGRALLLARITARAADALGLTEGQRVWAQVKSIALAG